MHVCVYMYTCIHTFSQSIGMLHLVGAFLVLFVSTCFTPHRVSNILGRQSQKYMSNILAKYIPFQLDNFLCLLTLVVNKLTEACTLPARRDALGAVLSFTSWHAVSPEDHSQDCDLGISG